MSKKSGSRTSVGSQRSKAVEPSKAKAKIANSDAKKKRSKVTSSPSSLDNAQEKPTVIRGISTALEMPSDTSLVNPESNFFLSDQIRRISILAICSTLIFGIGVQVGKSSNGTLVDDAIDTVMETGAQELDRELLERAAISGVLKATGDEWANYFPKSALEVLREQSSNTFTGIGVWLTKTRSGQIKIAFYSR